MFLPFALTFVFGIFCAKPVVQSGALAKALTTNTATFNYSLCDNNCAVNGFYCVPNNATVFYQCINGVRYPLQSCQPGLKYNYLVTACDWPSNYPGCNCANQSATTSTSTTQQLPTTSNPVSTTTSSGGQAPTFRRICYFTNWAIYRPAPVSYSVANVDPFMCTHIMVAFMNLQNAQISYLEQADSQTLATLTKMRDTQNPNLKVIVSIGGWNAGSAPFTGVLSTSATQQSFITQAISFLRQNKLDGLDIDWEYPLGQAYQFSTWLQQIRTAFESEAAQTGNPRLLLSVAVAAGQSNIDNAYDVPTLSQAVDMIDLMSYDLNGAWNPTTGLNSGLHPQTGTDPFNIQWCSNYWVSKGADPKKLNIGIPTYSRTFKLCKPGPTQTGIGASACGTGNAGVYTLSAGVEAYYESCLKLQCASGNWTSVWNQAGQAPYMYSGNQWISYENATSIVAKVNYAMSNNYGGVMVWALDFDDFGDICGCGVKSPLMRTLVSVATGQPLPAFNAVASATVNPCDTNSGSPGGGTAGTNASLSICDNNCEFNGTYCVPDNANAFYQCLNGNRYPLQYCPSSLKYNYLNNECDWPSNYHGCNCTMPSTTGSPTTSQTGTVASIKERCLSC